MTDVERLVAASGVPGGGNRHYPVVVLIRCHEFPEFVADTIDAVRYYADGQPLIVCTVDRNKRIAEVLRHAYPDVWFYTASTDCGWGGGLFRLFCESVVWLLQSKMISFDYLWNIDYDLIPIRKGWDTLFHKKFDSPEIGQIGRYSSHNSYWTRRVREMLPRLKKTFREHGKQWPQNYEIGRHVAGACGVFKGSCVAQMFADGLVKPPFSDLGVTCKLADDPMLSLMVSAAGYTFREMGYQAYIKWRMEEDYRELPGNGFYIYHPTKLVPGNKQYSAQVELECRNWFRRQRQQPPITMLADSPRVGRPNSILT